MSTISSTVSSSSGRAIPLSDTSGLRILLVGERESGRSAVGNAILGRIAFDAVGVRTREAVRRQGMAADRQLTVVDTPGWEWFPFGGSSLDVRREIVHGVTLCQPGPHAILLVVPLSFSFSRREKQVAVEHLELLGQKVWQHTLVLFTVKGGRLRHSTLEEEVEESAELQSLVDRCGGRFHGLYGRPRRGHDAVAELLAKLEDMVRANAGDVLSSEVILKEAKERREEEEKRQQEEERERKETSRRKREALEQRVKEERTNGEEEKPFEILARQQRRRRAPENRLPETVERRYGYVMSPPAQQPWFDLRKSCKTQ